MHVKLVRHGESAANAGLVDARQVGDANVELTERGHAQARAAGRAVGAEFLVGSLVYSSPYRRARQTLGSLLEGAGLVGSTAPRIYEDPRLREVEHGLQDVDAQADLRRTHGWFFYRFAGGESPADCYDRTSGFLESMMRQVERKEASRCLIVTHGLTIRCFVMRFLHLTVEEFDAVANPPNCAVVTIAPHAELAAPLFTSGRWGVEGLALRGEDHGR